MLFCRYESFLESSELTYAGNIVLSVCFYRHKDFLCKSRLRSTWVHQGSSSAVMKTKLWNPWSNHLRHWCLTFLLYHTRRGCLTCSIRNNNSVIAKKRDNNDGPLLLNSQTLSLSILHELSKLLCLPGYRCGNKVREVKWPVLSDYFLRSVW